MMNFLGRMTKMIPNNTPEFIERLEREYDTIFNRGIIKNVYK